jgi:hypothetical protein
MTESTYITTEQEKAFENAVKCVNGHYAKLCQAIDREDNEAADKYDDLYENAIERYAKKFGYTYNQFEDACTSARAFGYGID